MQKEITASTTKKEKVKGALTWLLLIAVIICCVITGFRLYKMRTSGEQAFIFGYRPAIVLTGSMEPYMLTHSICFNKQLTSPDDVEVGDVITYMVTTNDGKDILVTHRVIDIKDGLYYFKGDNNRVDDGYGLPFESLVSEVIGVWNGGVPLVNLCYWFADKFQEGTPTGYLICLSGAAAVICAYELICILIGSIWNLITGKKDPDEAEAQAEPAAEENPESPTVNDTSTEETP